MAASENVQALRHPFRPLRRRGVSRVLLIGAVVVGLAACGSDAEEGSEPTTVATASPETTAAVEPAATDSATSLVVSTSVAPTTTAAATTTTATTAASTIATSTSTSVPGTEAPSTTGAPVPLRLDDPGAYGIVQTDTLAQISAAWGREAVLASTLPDDTFRGCTSVPDPLIIQTGGLTMAFEEPPDEEAILTNWWYDGGPAGGFSEIIAPAGIRVGANKAEVLAAFPDSQEYPGEVVVYEPPLRYHLEGDVITGFGIIDCLLEGA